MVHLSFNHATHGYESIYITIYKALVRPHVEYVNFVCCPYKITDISEIETVLYSPSHKQSLLLSKNVRYSDSLKALRLSILKYRRLRGI